MVQWGDPKLQQYLWQRDAEKAIEAWIAVRGLGMRIKADDSIEISTRKFGD